MWSCMKNFFTYETTKSVVVKSWTIGIINRVVQLLIITYFIGWVFLYEKAYQVRDTAIESSVMTKVKGFGIYNNRVMDVADYVTPTQILDTNICCMSFPQGILTGKCVPFNTTIKMCEIKGWCPAEIDTIKTTPMMEVENFTIFIKNSIRFPYFNYTKGNFLPNITADYIKNCSFDMANNIYCPIFRVGDVVRYAQQNFTKLADKGGVIGIKIGWMCDLDKSDDQCNPSYSFTRLDAMSQKNAVSPGYNFRFAKYFKMENGTDYRTLVKAYAIRFDVLVNGNVKTCFTSFLLCDIILLNFLKGAEQYKAKKFEEVKYLILAITDNNVMQTIMRSSDSGAFSIEHYS
uniref:Purinergic receptor P2X, ligand-gated ion channel, 3b n=1 Tax=Stegastes partitus TaxID=144197 RepID=A0A3B4ZK51_9TELE